MKDSLEKLYYKKTNKEFKEILNNLKNNIDTIRFFDYTKNPYFYLHNNDSFEILIKLHKDEWEFNNLFNSFSNFGQKQIIQKILIDEIQSTNIIESINSTRHDIFYILNNLPSNDSRIISIVNSYRLLFENKNNEIKDIKKIRNIYDLFMKDALNREDILDGEIFRKNAVHISDGLKNVHEGFYPEEKIIKGMEEFLKLYNNKEIDIFERIILSHFLIETIHPFYDGNGRFGRFLFVTGLYNNTKSFLCLATSSIINKNKSKYYNLLQNSRKPHEFGSLNNYFCEFSKMLHKGYTELLKELNEKKDAIEKEYTINRILTKTEKRIFKILLEGSILSDYGVSNEEIINNLNISKRTLMYALRKFKNFDIIIERKIGKELYRKIDINKVE